MNSATPPLGIGIVGCGRIADLHALGYHGRADARIVAVCDTRKRAAQARAKAWGVDTIYTDYDRLLTDPAVELVELLVPHHLHAPMTIAACRAGKHVSVQKPMALTVTEAEAMMDAAEAAGVALRVYENFVFYPPYVRAKELLESGAIGEPQMIRVHVNTGKSAAGWKVPLRAWAWRFDVQKSGGGPLVFDHGYHLFSLAYDFMGAVERVSAWIDQTRVIPTKFVDAPATIMCQFKAPRRYGVFDFAHTPQMEMDSRYYADDNRVEIIGEKGILQVNRCTARTLDLPPLLLFQDGRTTAVPVPRFDWRDSFIDCTRHLIDALRNGDRPRLDGATGKNVLAFALAVQHSSRLSRPVRPDEVRLLEKQT